MKLLIPGPVTTHRTVRAALGHDFAPWDADFVRFYHGLGARLLRAGGGRVGTHIALTLPGCGHFVIEAAIRSLLPPGGRLLVPMTGVYAERMARLAREAGREVVSLPVGPEAPSIPSRSAAPCTPTPGSRMSVSSTARQGAASCTTRRRPAPRCARSAGA